MHYNIQLSIFFILISALLSHFYIFKRAPISLKILLTLSLISGLAYSFLDVNLNFDLISRANLRIISGKSLSFLFMFVFFVFSMGKKAFTNFVKIMIWLTIASSIMTIIMYFINLTQAWGLGLNTSTEGSYLSIMLPIVLFSNRPLLLNKNYWNLLRLLPIIAILFTGSSMGLFCGAFSIAIYYMAKNRIFLVPFFSFLLISAIFYAFYGDQIISSSGRIENWRLFIDWFLEHGNMLTGQGLGSFWGYGPYIQRLKNPDQFFVFVNAHNDWLQIFFELGAIGFFFSIISFFAILRKSISAPMLFSAFLTFGINAAMNMPLRYPITALAGLMITRIIIENENKKHS